MTAAGTEPAPEEPTGGSGGPERWPADVGGLRINVLRWPAPSQPPAPAGPRGDPAPPGPAPPVVLVHGMVVAGRSMVPLGRALAARGCWPWAPELPGFGLSARPAHALSVDDLADVVGQWLAQAGVGAVDLLGNSFGCQVAASVAARHPGVVRRLVLLAPTIDSAQRAMALPLLGPWRRPPKSGRTQGRSGPGSSSDPASRSGREPPGGLPGLPGRLAGAAEMGIMRWSWSAQGLQPPLGRLTAAEYVGTGLVRALATFRHAIVDDLFARLAGIPALTLVLRGARDRVVSAAWADRVAAALPRGRRADVPGANHSAQYLAAEAVAELVAPFLLGT